MRGVVTGGAGFLGSHVADVLTDAGHDVLVVDRVASPYRPSLVADIEDVEALAAAFKGATFVCHLAAIGDVYLAGNEPALAAAVNVKGTASVCDAALKSGVGRLIYASTWEVYGTPRYEPIDEDHPCDPDHPYSITKLAGERLALAYGHLRDGLLVAALRLGTAYGSRMRPNSVFSIFIDRAMRGETITIQGSGQQGRQFTHARDIGAAFSLALEKAKNGAVYNAVSDETTTIAQLAQEVVASLPTTIHFAPARRGEVPSARVSSARAKAELGWTARVPFKAGLRKMIEDARSAPLPSGTR